MEWLCPVLLIGVTLLAYSPVWDCDFVNYDDPVYVTENSHVLQGLSWEGLKWGLSTLHFGNWHPLVWWSLELDATLFGRNPAGFHTTNLLWHIGSVLLLYLALHRMTQARWPSAVVAALFALHPLNVESVAWVSERKGVLSTFFWMLTLWAYARYAERPSRGRYLVVCLGMILGLMAKPMLVTLPFVLLLLDYWPLRRMRSSSRSTLPTAARMTSFSRLVAEKVPLLVLVLIFSVLAFVAQSRAEALSSLAQVPFAARLQNACLSYLQYIVCMFYPLNLAPFYPHLQTSLPLWQSAGAALILVLLTVLFSWRAQQTPYLLVGWLWYLGTLVPVIGLVQVGAHARADRYVYVPLVGLFLMLAWGLADLAVRWRCERVVAGLAVVALSYCGLVCWTQAHYWHDSLTLWTHALEVTEVNPRALYNLGTALSHQGHSAQARAVFEEVLRLDPEHVGAHNNLGVYLLNQEKLDAAAHHFRAAIRLRPSSAMAHCNLGRALEYQDQWDEAVRCFRQAAELEPEKADYHRVLAFALAHQGQVEEAAQHYEQSLQLDPTWPETLGRNAWTLATHPDRQQRNGRLALRLALQVHQALKSRDARMLDVLAAAHAENQQFPKALEIARKARELTSDPTLRLGIEKRIRLYKSQKPYRTGSPSDQP